MPLLPRPPFMSLQKYHRLQFVQNFASLRMLYGFVECVQLRIVLFTVDGTLSILGLPLAHKLVCLRHSRHSTEFNSNLNFETISLFV